MLVLMLLYLIFFSLHCVQVMECLSFTLYPNTSLSTCFILIYHSLQGACKSVTSLLTFLFIPCLLIWVNYVILGDFNHPNCLMPLLIIIILVVITWQVSLMIFVTNMTYFNLCTHPLEEITFLILCSLLVTLHLFLMFVLVLQYPLVIVHIFCLSLCKLLFLIKYVALVN